MGQSGNEHSWLPEEHMNALLRVATQLKGQATDSAFAEAIRKAHVGLRVTFSNGCTLQSWERPEAALVVRMLYSHFAGGDEFYLFIRDMYQDLGPNAVNNLKVQTAARIIRRDMVERGNMEATDNLVIVLGINEVDKVLLPQNASSVAEARRAFLTPMLRALGEAMAGHPSRNSSSSCLCPLVCGSSLGPVKEAISESGCVYELLQSRQLTE